MALTWVAANSLAFSTSVTSNSRNSSQQQLGELAHSPINLQHVPVPRELHTIHQDRSILLIAYLGGASAVTPNEAKFTSLQQHQVQLVCNTASTILMPWGTELVDLNSSGQQQNQNML